MASRKVYRKYYQFQLENNSEYKVFNTYQKAFKAFHQSKGNATLYGTKQYGGDIITILKK